MDFDIMALFTYLPLTKKFSKLRFPLDITGFPEKGVNVRPGDEAFILGGPGHAVTAGELAEWWGTIPYEVTCLLGKNRAN